MPLKASFFKHTLHFKKPSGTSRGIISEKESWFILLTDSENPDRRGIGECGLLKGLSADDRPDYENQLAKVCERLSTEKTNELLDSLREWPSIQFGIETALRDLEYGGTFKIYDNSFYNKGLNIPMNGLIWMGDKAFMYEQIKQKIKAGFSCIKMKIGAIDFETELQLLSYIREQFSAQDMVLRVDANGAFSPDHALEKLDRLSKLDLHSIEQPIKANQWEEMAKLCAHTPLPIALDEELIGVFEFERKKVLMETINPQYIILKPSLHGGLKGSEEWISLAQQHDIPWWITSALESNIGLNAIAQFVTEYDNPLHQGLGTGQLYTNNIRSPLDVQSGNLVYNKQKDWDLSLLKPHV